MRAGMDAATITEYSEALAEADGGVSAHRGLHDGEKHYWADGFHRVNAAHRIGKFSQIPADVRSGTRRDAVLHAAGANASHGLRRTNGDKRRAVDVLLRDEEWSQWSDGEIARRCAVSDRFVASSEGLTRTVQESTLRKGADGRTINGEHRCYRSACCTSATWKSIVSRWMGEFWQRMHGLIIRAHERRILARVDSVDACQCKRDNVAGRRPEGGDQGASLGVCCPA